MLAIFGVLFYHSARPGEPTTRCRTNGVFGQNVCQRLGELAIKRRDVCVATHDLRQGSDQPALTAIFLSTLRASAVFGRVTVSTPFLKLTLISAKEVPEQTIDFSAKALERPPCLR